MTEPAPSSASGSPSPPDAAPARRLATRVLAGPPVRTTDFPNLHELFLISGITTILVIRTQLWLTNYPQLGGRGLHIAHLLWGGLFMVVAIGVQLTLLGRRTKRVTAVVGGVGFGFFIDELGKFITADNNYFYRPAAALIYLIFAGLAVLALSFRRRAAFTSREEIANAVDMLTESVRRELPEPDRRQALELLDRANPSDPRVAPLRSLLTATAVVPERGELRRKAVAALQRLTTAPRFETALVWLFGVWAVLTVFTHAELVFDIGIKLGGAARGFQSDRLGDLEIANVASVTSSLVSAALVIRGIVILIRTGSHERAYRSFDRARLVAIFVGQVFAFFESQFHAVFGLVIDLLLLAALRSVAAADENR
jgi:hypothetical protein